MRQFCHPLLSPYITTELLSHRIMGLLRASILTSIVYVIWRFLDQRWLSTMACETRVRITPWVPMALLFFVELLI